MIRLSPAALGGRRDRGVEKMETEDYAQELDAQDRYDDLVAQFERDGLTREEAIKAADRAIGFVPV